jgi:hypothetical protein
MQQFPSKICLPAVMKKQCYLLLGCLTYSSTLKKEAIYVLKTLVKFYKTTNSHSPEDNENPKSHLI